MIREYKLINVCSQSSPQGAPKINRFPREIYLKWLNIFTIEKNKNII